MEKKLALYMSLDELKQRYTESGEKAEKTIDILADLNDTESTFIAYLLYHLGCKVPARKMPRSPRTPEALPKDKEYRATEAWKQLEKKGITKGELCGLIPVMPLPPSPPEKPAEMLPKSVRIWIAYLRDQYSTAILSDEDLDVLRKLQTIF